MTRCARCDWRGETPSEHAAETGHLLCTVCQRRSLTVHEALTCGHCIGRVRADLADIVEAFEALEPMSVDALTLIGDGSMQRRGPDETFHDYELEAVTAHPLAREDEPVDGRTVRDEWPNDPLPVLPALVSWEDFIRHDLDLDRGGQDPTLRSVVDWLSANLDARAVVAQRFLAFDEFAANVRWLRSAIQHAAHLADDPVLAPATCPECTGQLIREYRPLREAVAYTRHGRDDEGLSDDWRCIDCDMTVNREDYAFRVAYTADAAEWVPLSLAAEMSKRPVSLIRVWISRDHVKSERRSDGLHVWWPDIRDRTKPKTA